MAVGYSRIYLGQHFLGDVLVGSLVGVCLAVLVHWAFTGRRVEKNRRFILYN